MFLHKLFGCNGHDICEIIGEGIDGREVLQGFILLCPGGRPAIGGALTELSEVMGALSTASLLSDLQDDEIEAVKKFVRENLTDIEKLLDQRRRLLRNRFDKSVFFREVDADWKDVLQSEQGTTPYT